MNKPILCCLKIKSATLLIGTLDLLFHMALLSTLLASLTHISSVDHYYTNSISLITFFSISSSASSSSCLSPASGSFSLAPQAPPPVPPPPPPPAYKLFDDPVALPLESAAAAAAVSNSDIVDVGVGRRRVELTQQFARLRTPSTVSMGTPRDKSMAFMITVFSALITSMLIYGVIKNRPCYLMPYFSVKVFQVVMASVTTLGFYTCLPNVRLWIEAHEYFPFKSTVLLVDNQTLELFVFAILLTSILLKLYEAIIVWYCYRYMVTIESFRNLSGIAMGPNGSSTNNGIVFVDDDAASNLGVSGAGFVVKIVDDESTIGGPPKYEEIFKAAARNKSNKRAVERDVAPSTSDQALDSAAAATSDSELSYIPSYSAAIRTINH